MQKFHDSQNENFILCFSKIIAGREINLFIKNYNIKDKLKFKYTIKSLKNNRASKPEIKEENDHLRIFLGNKDNKSVERFNYQLTIIFSNFFQVKLNIDCFLIPFTYLFQIYDYNKKYFSSEINLYLKGYQEYLDNNKIKNIVRPQRLSLYFRVIFPKFNYKGKIGFYPPNSNYIKTKNINIAEEFVGNFNFEVELDINDNIIEFKNNCEYLREKNLIFGIKLNGVKSEIKINLKIPPSCIEKNEYFESGKYAKYFKLIKYEKIQKSDRWTGEKITHYEGLIASNIFHISIFGTEPPIPDIKYKEINENKFMSLKINSINNQILKFTEISNLGMTIKYEQSSDICCKYETDNHIAILGYCDNNKNLWYPAFFNYDKYYERIDNKIKTNKGIIDYKNLAEIIKNDLEQKFSKSKLEGDFSLLAYTLIKLCSKWFVNDKIQEMKNFLSKLIDFFGDFKIINKITNILNILNNKKIEFENMCIEVILMLYYGFKERFEIINSLTKEKLKINQMNY